LVLLIGSPVLAMATHFVSQGSVGQEDEQEKKVEVGYDVGELSRRGPKQSGKKFGNIVKMPAKPPESRDQEQRFFCFVLFCFVLFCFEF